MAKLWWGNSTTVFFIMPLACAEKSPSQSTMTGTQSRGPSTHLSWLLCNSIIALSVLLILCAEDPPGRYFYDMEQSKGSVLLSTAVSMKIIGHVRHFQRLGPNVWWEISQIWIECIKSIRQMYDEPWKYFGYTATTLTQYVLMMPCDDRSMGQHWLR